MSHVTTVEIEVRDLDALAEAAKRCGLELVREQRKYRWYGRSVGDTPLPHGFSVEDLGQCEHAITVPGSAHAYEIGVVRRRDGRPGWALLVDEWAGGFGLVDRAGKQCWRLKQEYAAVVAAKTLRSQGYQVSEIRTSRGEVVVRGSRA